MLVVDDADAVRISLEALLTPEFVVGTAANVDEAEAKLARTKFQVVLTDHQMPGRSGLDLLKLLHERHPETVGILVTGNASYPEVQNARATWRDFRIVIKPYDPEALLSLVRNAAVFARLRQATSRLGKHLGP